MFYSNLLSVRRCAGWQENDRGWFPTSCSVGAASCTSWSRTECSLACLNVAVILPVEVCVMQHNRLSFPPCDCRTAQVPQSDLVWFRLGVSCVICHCTVFFSQTTRTALLTLAGIYGLLQILGSPSCRFWVFPPIPQKHGRDFTELSPPGWRPVFAFICTVA